MTTFIPRQISFDIQVNGTSITDALSARCAFSFDQGVATADWEARLQRAVDNDRVEIYMGATPGLGSYLRFDGISRNPEGNIAPQPGRSVMHHSVGKLQLAAEYFNGESPEMWNGGLAIFDLVGTQLSTAPAVISAVLTKAGVDFTPDNIQGTGRQYGGFPFHFIWASGTSTDPQQINFREDAGESALDYIRRWNAIEATISGNTGGFYRIVESTGGRIYNVLIGGRPRGTQDFTLDESINIISGNIKRGYQIANNVLVRGRDPGFGLGPWAWLERNDGPKRYDPNPPSSPMIEWPDEQQAIAAGYGMSCEVVAKARMLEVNRVAPQGSVTIAEDGDIGPGQTCLLQGPGGSPDRLLTGEKLWVSGVEISCRVQPDGSPLFQQTLTLLGGGNPMP